jgi:hypothetical protein
MTDDLIPRLHRVGTMLDALGASEGSAETLRVDVAAPQRRHWRRLVGSLACASLVVATGAWLVGRDQGTPTQVTASRPAVDLPFPARVLPVASNWSMRSVSQVRSRRGEVTFGNGEQTAELRWSPVGGSGAVEGPSGATADVVGLRATISTHADNDHVASWSDDGTVVVLRGTGDLQTFMALLSSLRSVDAATWSAALPSSAEDSGGPALEGILRGIPLAPDQTLASIRAEVPNIASHYQLTAEATSVVVCGWMTIWTEARENGDVAATARATAALGSTHAWPSLLAIEGEGGWSEVVWKYADAVVTGGAASDGQPNRTSVEDHRGALGC